MLQSLDGQEGIRRRSTGLQGGTKDVVDVLLQRGVVATREASAKGETAVKLELAALGDHRPAGRAWGWMA